MNNSTATLTARSNGNWPSIGAWLLRVNRGARLSYRSFSTNSTGRSASAEVLNAVAELRLFTLALRTNPRAAGHISAPTRALLHDLGLPS